MKDTLQLCQAERVIFRERGTAQKRRFRSFSVRILQQIRVKMSVELIITQMKGEFAMKVESKLKKVSENMRKS